MRTVSRLQIFYLDIRKFLLFLKSINYVSDVLGKGLERFTDYEYFHCPVPDYGISSPNLSGENAGHVLRCHQ